jgi:hypothetical protein
LTKETEDNLNDLAGNAMLTTVVGAATLGTLLVSARAFEPRMSSSTNIIPSIVPRPLNSPTGVSVAETMGDYVEKRLKLAPLPFRSLLERKSFIEAALTSSRKAPTKV